MVRLFKETYPVLRTLNIPRHVQDLRRGSFHAAKELDQASRLQLEQSYRARDLLNLMRARTFPGRPACGRNAR
jgi:methionyl-tRNA formyltransferase